MTRAMLALVALVVATLLLLSGCAKPSNFDDSGTAQKGILTGNVSIGPLCPVERIPPDPQCQPTEETYKAWPIAVWTADKSKKVAQLEPDAAGTFRTLLAAGNYFVDIDKQQPIGIGGHNLPATVTIKAGGTTTLDINIDTGIR